MKKKRYQRLKEIYSIQNQQRKTFISNINTQEEQSFE